MKDKRKDSKLYNIIFPIWMLFLFPITWVFILIGNLIIDSLVFIITMKILKIEDLKSWFKKHILKIFIFGLIADAIGTIFMFVGAYSLELVERPDALILTIPGLIISAILIFIFNYFITFKKEDKNIRFKLALTFAIVTAPYTFLIPMSWMY